MKRQEIEKYKKKYKNTFKTEQHFLKALTALSLLYLIIVASVSNKLGQNYLKIEKKVDLLPPFQEKSITFVSKNKQNYLNSVNYLKF